MSHPDVVDRILGRTKTKDMGTASVEPGAEPPSGISGKGTVDEAYDQGNTPDNTRAQEGHEPQSGKQGEGTAAEPYDQGNAQESTSTSQPTNSSTSNGTTIAQTDSSKTAAERTDRTSAPPRKHSEPRDVSPGTMADGSHAQTSGDRGESYEPSKGFNKLKGKLGIGKH